MNVLNYCRGLKKLTTRKYLNKIKTFTVFIKDSIPFDITIEYFNKDLNNIRISKGAKMYHKIYNFERIKLNIQEPYDKGMYAIVYNLPTNKADICAITFINQNNDSI